MEDSNKDTEKIVEDLVDFIINYSKWGGDIEKPIIIERLYTNQNFTGNIDNKNFIYKRNVAQSNSLHFGEMVGLLKYKLRKDLNGRHELRYLEKEHIEITLTEIGDELITPKVIYRRL